jgi:hypothetical protein
VVQLEKEQEIGMIARHGTDFFESHNMSDDFSDNDGGDFVDGGDFGGSGHESDSGGGGFWDTSPGGDSFTEESSTSRFSRLGSSITQMLVGMLLIPCSFFLLIWNKGVTVHRAQDLA